MNWFKDLFKWPVDHPASQPENKEVIPEKKPNISEPVISFIETFKANPKRFKVSKVSCVVVGSSGSFTFTLEDKYNKLFWTFNLFEIYGPFCTYTLRLDHYPSFLTKDEADFIYDNLEPYFNCRS